MCIYVCICTYMVCICVCIYVCIPGQCPRCEAFIHAPSNCGQGPYGQGSILRGHEFEPRRCQRGSFLKEALKTLMRVGALHKETWASEWVSGAWPGNFRAVRIQHQSKNKNFNGQGSWVDVLNTRLSNGRRDFQGYPARLFPPL